jgi:hypothetical protein
MPLLGVNMSLFPQQISPFIAGASKFEYHTHGLFSDYLSSACYSYYNFNVSGFAGVGVACWPLVPKFAGSNQAEAVVFLRAKKSSARLPSEGK